VLRPPPTSGPYARDFEAYYAAGAVWNAGGDPYSRALWPAERAIGGVDGSRDELLPYVGPAAALPLFGALARLPHPLAVRLWSGLLAAALGALLLAGLALARRRDPWALLVGLLLAIVSGPAISALALGQIALLSTAGIACALVACERAARSGAALAGGAFAMLVAGLQPNLALALIARVRDRAALLAASTAGLAFALLTLAAGGGPAGFAAYLHRLGEHGRAERFAGIQHTPAALAWALGAPAGTASAVGLAVALAALAALVALTVRARLGPRDGALLALAALPLIVPFFHEHDFAIELIPLLVLALRAECAARAWAGAAAVLLLVDWLGFAQRPAGGAQLTALGLAVAAAFAALGPGRRARRADLAPLLVLAGLAAVALPLGRAHPAPTWPDALPPGYRAPANADASAVWADEQRAAGLDARSPAWALLRAFPLAGCVALGAAVVLDRRR
jgi:hypothetical protein